MSAVPLGKAGVGSAMNDTTRELGGALGVAVLGSLVTSTYTSSIGDALSGLSGAQRTAAESGLVGAFGVARHWARAATPSSRPPSRRSSTASAWPPSRAPRSWPSPR